MTAIILAGGKSRRFGRDKAFARIGGMPIIKRQIKILARIFKKIIIVTNSAQRYRNIKGVKLVSDVILDIGPLGGIYSGLSASKSFYNFVIACDMPYINPGLIKYMYKNASGYDVIIPKVNHRYEPLFCIYSHGCLKYIKQLLNRRVFKVSELFPKVKMKEIKKQEILKFSSPERIFMNINTEEDLIKIK